MRSLEIKAGDRNEGVTFGQLQSFVNEASVMSQGKIKITARVGMRGQIKSIKAQEDAR